MAAFMEFKNSEMSLTEEICHDYLRRIKFDLSQVSDEHISVSRLNKLYHCHLTSVPFENLSITVLREVIQLDMAQILEKVVYNKRGGFCFEINASFAWLLRTLGFDVRLTSARIARPDGSFGPVHTHMNLCVIVDDNAYLVDVGMGRGPPFAMPYSDGMIARNIHAGEEFRLVRLRAGELTASGEPLPIDDDIDNVLSARAQWGVPQPGQRWRLYSRHLRESGEADEGSTWSLMHEVSTEFVPYQTFTGMCAAHQQDPDGPFRRGTVCTLYRADGSRVTLSSGVWTGSAAAQDMFTLFERHPAQQDRISVRSFPPHDIRSLSETLRTVFDVQLHWSASARTEFT